LYPSSCATATTIQNTDHTEAREGFPECVDGGRFETKAC